LKKLLLPVVFLTVAFGFSQSAKNKKVHVKYINETITADGVLDELSWQQIEPATNFWQHFPTDSVQSQMQSEIRFLFDDNNLYVGIKVNAPTNNFIIPSLRRDFRAGGNDNITLLFDTFNDATNAYIFGSNPEGVKREMLLSGGGQDIRDFNMAWDTKWSSEAAVHDDHYILEWIIPLSAFKYTEGTTKWRFNSYHFDTQVNANPFFSIRIGIARDIEGNSIENDIIAGVRLSGKINDDLRLGVLNMQTAEDIANEIPTTNNAVITAQHKVFDRSNISVMFINKQSTKDYDFLEDEDKYNRVLGIDYRLASANNKWTGNYFFHKSFSPGVSSKDYSAGASTTYNSKNWAFFTKGVYVGDNYRSDLGFIRRTDMFKTFSRVERFFWPKSGAINQHTISFTPVFHWRPTLDFELSDHSYGISYTANFNNTADLEVEISNRFTHLYDSFDPTRTEDAIELPSDSDYYYTSFDIKFKSDQRKKFSYEVAPSIGNFYNGKKFSFEGKMSLRVQPYFTSSIQINYDNINLPNPYADAKIWLIGPRIDLTFNKKLFWATFIQYSNQRDNLSINSRLQWRFAPLSDLYVVYNDNYYTDNIFAPRVRSLNLKLTYWLNI